MVAVHGSRRTTAARTGAAVLSLGVLAAVGVVAATPALAAVNGTINTPADGASYVTAQKLGVDGTVTYANGDSGTASITATDPDNSGNSSTGCAFQVASASYAGSMFGATKTDVAGPLDLNAAYPKNCPAAFVGKPAVNGRWELTLTTSAGTTVNSFFTTAVPPAAPSGVKASSTAPLSVTVSWSANQELDTHAYAILNGQGQAVSGPGDAADLCSGTSCTATFGVDQAGSQSFSVRAYRYTSPPNRPTTATAGDLSADSGAQTVNVQAKPAATAGPSSTASPAAGGAGGSTTTASRAPDAGTTAAAQQSAGASGQTGGTSGSSTGTGSSAQPKATSTPKLIAKSRAAGGSGAVTLKSENASGAEAAKISSQFSDFAAPSGIDKLPPLPKLDASGAVTELPAIAAADDGEPTDQGTFKLSLGYAPQSKVVATTTTSPGEPLSFVADAIGISPSALWRSLAGSLVLLLLAGHVRRWARQPIE